MGRDKSESGSRWGDQDDDAFEPCWQQKMKELSTFWIYYREEFLGIRDILNGRK